jgi:MFS family permease
MNRTSDAAGQKNPKLMVIGASCLGTMFEYYDFFLYGALATHIAQHFFSALSEASAFIFALIAFAVGFVVRPLGALAFGRIGDMFGRKNTFLVTMALMGLSTFVVGLLPGYSTIGIAAPIALICLRILQGLAIGGEYAGAAIYVAEHAASRRRGFATGWIQTTAALGLLLSLAVIVMTRAALAPEAFAAWGWRIPFLVSIVLLTLSLWMRLKLNESPVFQRMKAANATSKAPLAEAFGRWSNLKIVLTALFGCIAGQAVTFYVGTFYALFFLERTVKVDAMTASVLMAIALGVGTFMYVVFGWLSDRIGRKSIVLAGLALGTVGYFPLFNALTAAANPVLAAAEAQAPVLVVADPSTCSFQFDLLGRAKFDTSSCDIAKSFLTRAGVAYENEAAPAGASAEIRVGESSLAAPEPSAIPASERSATLAAFESQASTALSRAGYPATAEPARMHRPAVVLILIALIAISAMTYGPMAALLTELFPARVRYTSMSLPYHIGNGWFGGFLPATSFAIVAASGDHYAGLWYPTIVSAATLVIGILLLPETRGRNVGHEDLAARHPSTSGYVPDQ